MSYSEEDTEEPISPEQQFKSVLIYQDYEEENPMQTHPQNNTKDTITDSYENDQEVTQAEYPIRQHFQEAHALLLSMQE
jgi:hypothetical protein